jgi:alpha-ribazole phosphatase
MTVWLARHAQVIAAPGLCYGALELASDSAATQVAAVQLAAVLPEGALVRCSPRQRCRDLAAALGALRVDLPAPQEDARLAEMDFGQWEGQLWSHIGKDAVDAWTADFWVHRFGGRQSVQEFMAGVEEAWQEQAALAGDAVWITHAGVIRACSLLHQGKTGPLQAHEWVGPDVAMGGLIQLDNLRT